MSREAMAPCLVCGNALVNIDETDSNQPVDANCFVSYGHYGSMMFDPMNGEFLEVNVCASCLRTAAEQGRVLIAREKKPVVVPYDLPGVGVLASLVGWTSATRQYVPWKTDMAPDEEDLVISTEIDWEAVKDRVELTTGGRGTIERMGWTI